MRLVQGQDYLILLCRQRHIHGTGLQGHQQGNKVDRKSGLDIEDKGNIEDYLGANIKEKGNGKINLTQNQIINSIINNVQLPKNTAPRQTPTFSTKILRRDAASPPFDERFNYPSVVVKINFLEKSTRPNIAYATHQCACFYKYPRESHGDAIIHLVKYLKATREQGIVLYPEFRKSFEVYDDAYFCGNWYLPTSGDNLSTTNSHTVYVILYDGCPIILCSKLQTKIALSTTNAGYIALLQSLLDVIPIMQLLR